MASVSNLTKNVQDITNNFTETTSLNDLTNNASSILKNPSKMIDKLKNSPLLKNKLNIFLLLLVLVLLAITAYIVYHRFLKNRLNPKYVSNNEFNNTNEESEDAAVVTIKLYHAAEWCPHSRDALDPQKGNWHLLKSELDNTVKNGKKLVFEEIDCSKLQDDDQETKDIDGYPTIKLVTNTENLIYNNDISSSNKNANKQLKEFIDNNI